MDTKIIELSYYSGFRLSVKISSPLSRSCIPIETICLQNLRNVLNQSGVKPKSIRTLI